jgi:hypothetical protein
MLLGLLQWIEEVSFGNVTVNGAVLAKSMFQFYGDRSDG